MSDASNLEKDLEQILGSVWRAPKGALVTLALTQGNPGSLIMCRWEFRDECVAARNPIDYGALIMEEYWIDSADLAKRTLVKICAGEQGFGLREPWAQYRYSRGGVERKISPSGGISGWSEWQLVLRSDGNPGGVWEYGPLVRAGLKPFRSGGNAVTEWVWGKGANSGSGVLRKSEIVVVVPDTRARVTEAAWTPMSLRVSAEVRAPIAAVEAQTVAVTPEGDHALPVCKLEEDGSAIWTIPRNTTNASIYLVHNEGDLLAQADVVNTGAALRVGSEPAPEEQAEIDLRRGESENVEFKPFLRADHEKAMEVVKSAIAFANSDGGRIYFGVTDDAEIQGEPALLKAMKAAAGEAMDAFEALITKLMRERIKPLPEIKMQRLEIRGEPVLVASVARGKKRPYSTDGNEVFIRKGASNRRPDPHSELLGLYAQPGGFNGPVKVRA